jgi:2-phospho-L-lactate guanylyltransferase
VTRPAAAAVIVPIRGFEGGKQRLGPPLDAGQRAALLRSMAERVVLAAGPLPVAVVSGAREVRAWAASFGLVLLDDPGSLNQAAVTGVRWAASQGIARAVVAHADLPLATTLGPLARDGSRPIVAAVPCHRDDGTPVLSIPTESSFAFAYGPGSFRRHAAEARRLRLGFRVVRDPSLARDLDIPADMAGLPLLGEPGGPERASALG